MRRFLTALCLMSVPIVPALSAAPAPLARPAAPGRDSWPEGVWRLVGKNPHTTLTLRPGGRAVERWDAMTYERRWEVWRRPGIGAEILIHGDHDGWVSLNYVLLPDGPGRMRTTHPYTGALFVRVR